MQTKIILSILLLCMLFYNLLAQLPPTDPNYELVFEDNFDGSSVDASKWNSGYPWNQTGYIDVSYCNNIPSGLLTPDNYGYRKRNFENCNVNSGIIKIVSKQERCLGRCWSWPLCTSDSCIGKSCDNSLSPPKCLDEDDFWFNYTTNMLMSKETFKYGYFEIRCKLPKPVSPKTNKGIGPNFWLWASNSAVTWSEIDIFEFNGENNTFGANIHYEDINGNINHSIPNHPSPIYVDFSTFHTFAVHWTPDKLDFYLDGNLFVSSNLYASELIAMPLIIDVNFPLHTMCQLLDPVNTQLPHNYEIDYVRVYQLKYDCNGDYQICNSITDLNNYEDVTIGGTGCNPKVSAGQTLNITANSVNIESSFSVESSGQLNYNFNPCYQSIHTFPSKTKAALISQPAPESFYKRLNSKYHEY